MRSKQRNGPIPLKNSLDLSGRILAIVLTSWHNLWPGYFLTSGRRYRLEFGKLPEVLGCGFSSSARPMTSSATVRGPCAEMIPNSAKCARMAFRIIVRCRISKSRDRCSTRTPCCSSVFTGTNRMFGRVTASQMASESSAWADSDCEGHVASKTSSPSQLPPRTSGNWQSGSRWHPPWGNRATKSHIDQQNIDNAKPQGAKTNNFFNDIS